MMFDLGEHNPHGGENILEAQVLSRFTTSSLLLAQNHRDPSSLMTPAAGRGPGDFLSPPLTTHNLKMIFVPSKGLTSTKQVPSKGKERMLANS